MSGLNLAAAKARRLGTLLLLLSQLLLGSSCTVADNLSYREIITELDDLVVLEGPREERRLVYRQQANVSTWYMRSPVTWPFRGLLAWIFGERQVQEIENPVGHARVLIEELPDEVGRHLERAAGAAVRLLLLAELDAGPGIRSTAIGSLGRICTAAAVPMFAELGPDMLLSAAPEQLATFRQAMEPLAMSRRGELTAAAREAGLAALVAIGQRPLPLWQDRVDLIADLLALFEAEREPSLRASLAAALRAAIARAGESLLLRVAQQRDREHVEVRLYAIQQIRRHGGPAAVPWLLALLSASAADVAAGVPRFDPDLLIRLRLIHLCGQLRGELAYAAVRLPGAAAWEAIAPVDFLAQTILAERLWLSPVLLPAMHALSLCLERREYDYDVAWVRQWYRERQTSL